MIHPKIKEIASKLSLEFLHNEKLHRDELMLRTIKCNKWRGIYGLDEVSFKFDNISIRFTVAYNDKETTLERIEDVYLEIGKANIGLNFFERRLLKKKAKEVIKQKLKLDNHNNRELLGKKVVLPPPPPKPKP